MNEESPAQFPGRPPSGGGDNLQTDKPTTIPSSRPRIRPRPPPGRPGLPNHVALDELSSTSPMASTSSSVSPTAGMTPSPPIEPKSPPRSPINRESEGTTPGGRVSRRRPMPFVTASLDHGDKTFSRLNSETRAILSYIQSTEVSLDRLYTVSEDKSTRPSEEVRQLLSRAKGSHDGTRESRSRADLAENVVTLLGHAALLTLRSMGHSTGREGFMSPAYYNLAEELKSTQSVLTDSTSTGSHDGSKVSASITSLLALFRAVAQGYTTNANLLSSDSDTCPMCKRSTPHSTARTEVKHSSGSNNKAGDDADDHGDDDDTKEASLDDFAPSLLLDRLHELRTQVGLIEAEVEGTSSLLSSTTNSHPLPFSMSGGLRPCVRPFASTPMTGAAGLAAKLNMLRSGGRSSKTGGMKSMDGSYHSDDEDNNFDGADGSRAEGEGISLGYIASNMEKLASTLEYIREHGLRALEEEADDSKRVAKELADVLERTRNELREAKSQINSTDKSTPINTSDAMGMMLSPSTATTPLKGHDVSKGCAADTSNLLAQRDEELTVLRTRLLELENTAESARDEAKAAAIIAENEKHAHTRIVAQMQDAVAAAVATTREENESVMKDMMKRMESLEVDVNRLQSENEILEAQWMQWQGVMGMEGRDSSKDESKLQQSTVDVDEANTESMRNLRQQLSIAREEIKVLQSSLDESRAEYRDFTRTLREKVDKAVTSFENLIPPSKKLDLVSPAAIDGSILSFRQAYAEELAIMQREHVSQMRHAEVCINAFKALLANKDHLHATVTPSSTPSSFIPSSSGFEIYSSRPR